MCVSWNIKEIIEASARCNNGGGELSMCLWDALWRTVSVFENSVLCEILYCDIYVYTGGIARFFLMTLRVSTSSGHP